MSKNTEYTVPIYQIAYFINSNYNFTDSEIEYFEKLFPIEVWRNSFELNDGDSISRPWRVPKVYEDNFLRFDYSKTLFINMKMLLKKPIMYFKSLTGLTNVLWKISDNNYEVNFNRLNTENKFKGNEFFATYNIFFTGKNGDSFEFKENSFFTKLVIDIENIFFYKSLLFNIKSRGGFALYILIISSILFIYKKQSKYILAILPLILWLLLLFISIPRSLTRYIIVFVISWPIIFLLSLSCQSNKNKKELE